MLTVDLYKTIEEFCKDQNNKTSSNTLYICPGPQIADGVRSLFENNAEIITIAKWVNDQLKKNNLKRVMKSELLLRLASAWRHFFPETQEEIFFRAFDIFTDLRSFTLDKDLLFEALEELDPDLKKSILLFWVFLESEKLIDEQLAYKLVSDEENSRPLCFVGFKHMNAIQLDMMRSLSVFKNISVAFPVSVYQDSLSSDWIRWILPETDEANLSPLTEVIRVNTILFQKNKLNLHLKEYRKSLSEFDVVIPTSRLEIEKFQEVLKPNLFFKTSLDLFRSKREKIFLELTADNISIEALNAKILNSKNIALAAEDFITYKLCMMIEESIEVFKEMTSSLDNFYLSVLKEVILLNSPRNFLISLSEKTTTSILSLDDYRFYRGETPAVIIASSLYGSLSAKEKPYHEKILKVLMALGPLKRGGLDFLFAKDTLFQLLAKSNSILFLEEGLTDQDLAWREVLKQIEKKNITFDMTYELKKIRDIIAEKTIFKSQDSKSLSATRLQSYMDCPRKFYFTYIEKVNIRPEIRLTLDPDEKGNLEHQVIGEYLNNNRTYNFNVHAELCKNILNKYIATKSMIISKQNNEEIFYEILEYTKNGISFLLDLKRNFPLSSFQFEVSLPENEFGIRGSIDCIMTNGNELFVLDFKRSQASIGSKKDLLNFEKIQLWIYCLILEKSYLIKRWGYLNLSDGEETLFDGLGPDSSIAFKEFLIKLIKSYKEEVSFNCVPRNKYICDFCDLKLVCPKEKIL